MSTKKTATKASKAKKASKTKKASKAKKPTKAAKSRGAGTRISTRQSRLKHKPKRVAFAPALEDYSELLSKLDFFQGKRGKQSISPQVQPLLTALHQVLAGGRLVEQAVIVEGAVDEQTVERLDALAMRAMAEANRINDRRIIVCYG